MEPRGPFFLGALGKCLVCLSLRPALVISIIIDAPAVSCTPKIDLQAFFVTTAVLLCLRVVVNKRI